ncbi:MAG: mhqR [Firmicutes bacterium]|nr:mhqR [Bacillota bacterium]
MKNNSIIHPPHIQAELGQLLLRLADDVIDAVNDSLEQCHISESKLNLLLILTSNNTSSIPLQPSEIAKRLGIRRSSVTKQLVWLEKHQFIARTISQEDQRMVNVNITAKGYQLLNQAMPLYWQTCSSFSNNLTYQEALQLFALLKKIKRAIPD